MNKKLHAFYIHAFSDCYFSLQTRMSVIKVLLLVDCKPFVKIPQGFTGAPRALRFLTPRRKTAKILMSVRRYATRMLSVVRP